MTFRTVAAAAGIALVLIYMIGSSLWVNTGDSWYRDLAKPSWQPPSYLFGLIWPYNFVVIGIASVLIAQRASKITTSIYLSFSSTSNSRSYSLCPLIFFKYIYFLFAQRHMISECARVSALAPASPPPLVCYEALIIKNLDRSSGKELPANSKCCQIVVWDKFVI